MPQLDLTIIFSQIFWLFVFFFIVYTATIHFFLPKFIVSIKARKKIVEFNSTKILQQQQKLASKQENLHDLLLESLILIKKTLAMNWSAVLKTEADPNLILVDKKISMVIFNMVKYCDYELINSIELYPKHLNN